MGGNTRRPDYTVWMTLDALFPERIDVEPGGPLQLPTGGGVYLLSDAEDRPVQLAAAGSLKRVLAARLSETPPEEPATGRRRLELWRIVRRIRWIPADSQFELTWRYLRIARELMPDSYQEQLAFPPAWFVHVDPVAEVPRFSTGRTLKAPPGMDIGPFATGSDAGRFVQILQDAFDLCRYENILEQAPHGQPCAYYEMGRCPAPCDGSVPMALYRETLHSALAFACGDREPLYAGLTARMREQAANQAFERAAATKSQIERARGIEHESFRHARPITTFDYLVLQRGGGATRVRPFFVRAGRITAGESVRLRDAEKATPDWLRAFEGAPVPTDTVGVPLAEEISLVAWFLFKREPPGMYLHAGHLPPPPVLLERVRETFGRKPRPENEIGEPAGLDLTRQSEEETAK